MLHPSSKTTFLVSKIIKPVVLSAKTVAISEETVPEMAYNNLHIWTNRFT
jgi:hypothetical protein